MSQVEKSPARRDFDNWLQQLLIPITAAQAKIQAEIRQAPTGEWKDGWIEAEQSLEDAIQRLEEIAAIAVPQQIEPIMARQASFPELNPNPVLEIDRRGEILFANQATLNLFPDILEKKNLHPFLAGFERIYHDLAKNRFKETTREIKVDQRHFRQSIFYVKEYGCLRVYAMDITRHVQTEESLRRNQNLLKAIMDGTPDPIFLKDPSSRLLMANPATAAVVGKPLEQIMNKTDAEIYDDPAVAQAIIENDRKVVETGQTSVVEERVVNRDGERIYLSTKTPYRDQAGDVIAIIGIARDITERKMREQELDRLNRTMRAISNCSQALIHAQCETSFMEQVCQIVVNDCGHAMVWIGLAEKDENKAVRPVASAGFEEGYLDTLAISWSDNERGQGPTGTAIRTGQVSMCKNMHTDPAFKPWRAEALKRGYQSSIVFPLFANGEPFGALTIYSRQPDPFSKDEIILLTELSSDLAFGISAIRTREAQAQAVAALRLSEERYHALFTRMSEGYALHEMLYDDQGQPRDYRFLDINPAFERLTSLKREDVIGKSHNQVMPDDDPRWVKIYGEVAVTGRPAHFENYSPALKAHYEVYAYRPAPDQFAVLFMDITERKLMEEKLHAAQLDLEQRV